MDQARQRIVVGIDGSDGARAALVWALTEAAARSAPVEVVTAFPVDFYWTDAYLLDTRRIEAIRADTEARSRSGCCTASWPTPRPTTRSSAAGRAPRVPCDDCSMAESPQALADLTTAASALTQH